MFLQTDLEAGTLCIERPVLDMNYHGLLMTDETENAAAHPFFASVYGQIGQYKSLRLDWRQLSA